MITSLWEGPFTFGIGWRIGTGESVNIWNDQWVPSLGHGRMLCQNIDTRYIMVVDLIYRDDYTWILAIPLAHSRPPNTFIWSYDGTDSYSVRSGYRLLLSGSYITLHPSTTIGPTSSSMFTTLCGLCLFLIKSRYICGNSTITFCLRTLT